jgi:hypothetical protein
MEMKKPPAMGRGRLCWLFDKFNNSVSLFWSNVIEGKETSYPVMTEELMTEELMTDALMH